jgi:hypothetical protein
LVDLEYFDVTGIRYFQPGAIAPMLSGPFPQGAAAWTKLANLFIEGNAFSGQVLPPLPFEQMVNCLIMDHREGAGANSFMCPWPTNASRYCRKVPLSGPWIPITGADCLPSANACVSSSANLTQAECNVWLDWFDSTGGPYWKQCNALRNDPCACNHMASYVHVTCMPTLVKPSVSRITKIRLVKNGLDGTVPGSIGTLAAMWYFEITGNSMRGTIPDAVTTLSQLQFLGLDDNQFEGSIPQNINQLSNLNYLWLDHNKLSGTIPDTVGELANLRGFTLEDNQITGTIPASLAQLHVLIVLRLCNNLLSGLVPPLPFRQYNRAQTDPSWADSCDIGGNNYTCPLPEGAAACNTTVRVSCVSPCIGKSNVLAVDQCLAWIDLFEGTGGEQWTHCSENKLDPCSCAVPSSGQAVVCDSTNNVKGIYLGDSNLRGTLPSSIGAFTSITEFHVESVSAQLGPNRTNFLAGTVPASLGNWAAIQDIDVSGNQLRGTIGIFGELKSLQALDVDLNHFWGPVPDMGALTGEGADGSCHLYANFGVSATNKFTCQLPPSALEHCTSFNGTGWAPVTVADCIPNRCTGTSVNLEPRQCDAWILLFDAMGGSSWDFCNSTRTDPCSCMNYDAQTPVCNKENTSVLRV